MKEFTKVVKFEDIKNAIGGNDEIIEKEWNGCVVEIKPHISMLEVMAFVDDVVRLCFIEDALQYTPEILDYAIRASVIRYYTNVELSGGLSERYEFVCWNNLADAVIECIDCRQYGELLAAIDSKIKSIEQKNINTFAIKTNDVMDKFEKVSGLISSLFEGVGEGDITELINNLSALNVSEDKLVEAVVNKQSED